MNSSKTDSQKALAQERDNRKKRSARLAWLILLLLLLLFFLQWRLQKVGQQGREVNGHQALLDSLRRADSLAALDSLTQRLLDSLRRADSLHREDSLRVQDSLNTLDSLRRLDSLRSRLSTPVASSSHAVLSSSSARSSDSLPPEPVLVPPPGRFFEPVAVKVLCPEPGCRGQLRLGDTLAVDATIPSTLSQSQSIYFRATDSAGNTSAWEKASYEVVGGSHACGARALPVPVGGKQVCVDVYEWPNRPDEQPKDMVSHGEAERLCQSAGKRLCTVNEWQAACKGEDGARYPYGRRYDPGACVTARRTPERSGRQERCRSWWGMFDMSGNLWEWTATAHTERAGYYYAAGGSWNTRDASSCQETKFSFFPQNQYTFVGFRCCSDSP